MNKKKKYHRFTEPVAVILQLKWKKRVKRNDAVVNVPDNLCSNRLWYIQFDAMDFAWTKTNDNFDYTDNSFEDCVSLRTQFMMQSFKTKHQIRYNSVKSQRRGRLKTFHTLQTQPLMCSVNTILFGVWWKVN